MRADTFMHEVDGGVKLATSLAYDLEVLLPADAPYDRWPSNSSSMSGFGSFSRLLFLVSMNFIYSTSLWSVKDK